MKRKRFLRRRIPYSANRTASFNPSILVNILSGDIHPQPGPNFTSNSSSTSTSTNANISFPCNMKSNTRIAYLNIRSLKSRQNFILLKQSVVSNSFDIFTISETWLDSSVNNESIHIPGYSLYRQDRGPHKPGGGLCVYIKENYKVSSMENVSSVSDNNFQQLWLKVQSCCYKSFVICTILDSNGNSNSIWKIINRCLPRKQQDSFMASEDLTGLANELNEFLTSVGSITAQKASDLTLRHGLHINLD
ncbi:hypothetical protein P5673_004829, partial [Acropora cervicornis]